MLIEIHAIQNHSPANLNRDDLGAPKTCYFGGVLRSRISSQCLKRSIRRSDELKELLGGVRTRQLAKLIAQKAAGKDARKRAEKILEMCGFKPKKSEADSDSSEKSKMLVYTSTGAVEEMASLLRNSDEKDDGRLAEAFAKLIAQRTAVPDMALSGRMLEPDKASTSWKELDTTVEAALQVAHAISTHEARPEVDYYVAADDIPGEEGVIGMLCAARGSAAPRPPKSGFRDFAPFVWGSASIGGASGGGTITQSARGYRCALPREGARRARCSPGANISAMRPFSSPCTANPPGSPNWRGPSKPPNGRCT
jgi:hypothetical protein